MIRRRNCNLLFFRMVYIERIPVRRAAMKPNIAGCARLPQVRFAKRRRCVGLSQQSGGRVRLFTGGGEAGGRKRLAGFARPWSVSPDSADAGRLRARFRRAADGGVRPIERGA